MVKCKLRGKVYDTRRPEVEISVEDDPEFVEDDPELEEKALRLAVEAASKIVPSHFDELGWPHLKIIYVDSGDFHVVPNPQLGNAYKYKRAIEEEENQRAREEGLKPPRLIFVLQDRDYWPNTENDPQVMARRAAKALNAQSDEDRDSSDFKEIFVARFPGEFDSLPRGSVTKVFMEEFHRLLYLQYYDPARPGTKFILDNEREGQRKKVIEKYKADPDLWSKWMEASKADTILEATGSSSSSVEMTINGQDKLMKAGEQPFSSSDEMGIDGQVKSMEGVALAQLSPASDEMAIDGCLPCCSPCITIIE